MSRSQFDNVLNQYLLLPKNRRQRLEKAVKMVADPRVRAFEMEKQVDHCIQGQDSEQEN